MSWFVPGFLRYVRCREAPLVAIATGVFFVGSLMPVRHKLEAMARRRISPLFPAAFGKDRETLAPACERFKCSVHPRLEDSSYPRPSGRSNEKVSKYSIRNSA